MSVKPNGVSRRDFFRVVGAGATGYVLTASGVPTEAATLPTTQPASMTVPTRTFGKTGVKVSILSLGGIFDIPKNQLILKQAIRYGVTYWDTANSYGKGKSEEGIGKYFQKNPGDRKKIFLVTKSGKRDLEGMTKLLNRSLERMKTDYIDLYFLHGVSKTGDFTGLKGKALMQWVAKAKAKGKIRFFGFSTHSNMEKCLLGAAKERFIDGIMLRYSHMSMNTDNMKRAVDACHGKGIGLTAMKTQAARTKHKATEAEQALIEQLAAKGFTPGQIKLKAVWDNPKIACICSQMPNLRLLAENVAAAANKTKLTSSDKRALERDAQVNRAGYCAGCADLCESAIGGAVPISDVMRCLMYRNEYGEVELARETFESLPARARAQLAHVDYSAAERRCPNRLPIAELMAEAVQTLA